MNEGYFSSFRNGNEVILKEKTWNTQNSSNKTGHDQIVQFTTYQEHWKAQVKKLYIHSYLWVKLIAIDEAKTKFTNLVFGFF